MTLAETLNLILQALIWGAMLGAFYYAHKQLAVARESAMGQNILAVISYLQTGEVRAARMLVIKELGSTDFRNWTEEQRHAAALVCSTYDITSVLVRQGYVPLNPIVQNWGPSIRKCHQALAAFIGYMQSPEMNGPAYWDDFSWLYQEAIKIHGVQSG
jgi:hypothetical protein